MIPVNNIYLSSEIGESVGTCTSTGKNEVRSMEIGIGHKSCHKSQAHRAKHLRTSTCVRLAHVQ